MSGTSPTDNPTLEAVDAFGGMLFSGLGQAIELGYIPTFLLTPQTQYILVTGDLLFDAEIGYISAQESPNVAVTLSSLAGGVAAQYATELAIASAVAEGGIAATAGAACISVAAIAVVSWATTKALQAAYQAEYNAVGAFTLANAPAIESEISDVSTNLYASIQQAVSLTVSTVAEVTTTATDYATQVSSAIDQLESSISSDVNTAFSNFLTSIGVSSDGIGQGDFPSVDQWLSGAVTSVLAETPTNNVQAMQDFDTYIANNVQSAPTDLAVALQAEMAGQSDPVLENGLTIIPSNDGNFTLVSPDAQSDTITDTYTDLGELLSQTADYGNGQSQTISYTSNGASVSITDISGSIYASESLEVSPSEYVAFGRVIDGVTLEALGPASPSDLSVGPDGSIIFGNLDTGLFGTDAGDTAIASSDGSITIIANEGGGTGQPVITFTPGQIFGETLGFPSLNPDTTDVANNVLGLTTSETDINGVVTSTEYVAILSGGTATPPGLSDNENVLFSGAGGTLNLSYPTLTEAETEGFSLGILNFQLGDVVDLANLQSEVDADNSVSENFPTINFSYTVTATGGMLNADILETISGDVTTTETVASSEISLGPYLGFITNDITTAPDGTGGVYVYSLDLAGATVASALRAVTVAVETGETVNLGNVFAASNLAMNTLILQGPGIGTLSGLGMVANLEVAPGGNLVLQGGTIVTDPVTVDASGNISGYGTITGNETANGTITASGGTLDITGNVNGTGALTFNSGASLLLEGTIATTESVLFNGSNEFLNLGTAANVLAPISGFGAGDMIAINGQTVTSAIYDTGDNMLAVTGSGGEAYALTFTGSYQQSDFAVTNGAVESTTPLCFLPGTRIATPDGEVPVEQLATGDEVVTHSGEARRIVWVGNGRVLATRAKRNAATPVIVRKGALADNVPHHDLRVTKAHALYIDDALIPVEFLVNHRSILWDDHAQEVTLYHIELDSHDVLIANNAPAESYRDDGNRWLFQNANSGWGLPPQEPYAPVLTGGPLVDTAWWRLLERSGPRSGVPTTDDPDLHLFVDGERVNSTSDSGMLHVFRLAARPATMRIVSRSGVPQELGTARDPRSLGVALRQITVSQGIRFRTIEAEDARLTDGFHEFEASEGIRWTDGDAAVPADLFDGFDGPFEIVLRLGGMTSYVDKGIIQRVA
jgi:hypothetical protein